MVLLKETCSLRTIGRRSFSARREEVRSEQVSLSRTMPLASSTMESCSAAPG